MLESTSIQEQLFALQDKHYAEFQSKLIPTLSAGCFIGVRTPELRTLAKQLIKQGRSNQFTDNLPHKYFDEYQLHAFVISEIKDFNTCINEVNRFLPFIDNWATCDQLTPKVLGKCTVDLIPYINGWLASNHVYTVRFGIKMLMSYYLDNNFKPCYLAQVVGIRSEDYYIRMMQAWYLATALAKQWQSAIIYIEPQNAESAFVDSWVRRKTIQKAIESYRITPEQKQYLKTLR